MNEKFTAINFRNSTRFLVLIFLLTITNQCKNDLEVKPFSQKSSSQKYLIPNTVKDHLAVKLAKILAQKMLDQSVRDFIKQNALKKFDEDYNFLFADTYNFLLDKNKEASFIDSVLMYFPLMQIVVPELITGSPENWNTATHIPLVAVVPENHQPGKDTLVGAYDGIGGLHMLSTRRHPKELTVVISENVRTEFYLNGQEPFRDKVGKSGNKRMLSHSTSSKGNYYLKKDVANFNNLRLMMLDDGDGGGGGGGYTPPSCDRAGMSPVSKDIIGDMRFQNFDVLESVEDWTGSGADFKMDIDYGGINGSPVKNFSVYFYASSHASSSCDFFLWCWATQFSPSVPTLSWDRANDGDQMLYTLYALGNGSTTSTSYGYTATAEGGISVAYNVTKSISSKDQVLGKDYVKYCEPAFGRGTMYAVNQYAYFYIHR